MEISEFLKRESPFPLEAAQFLLGFKTKEDIHDLNELIAGWASFEEEHRHTLLHGFLEGKSTDELLDDWYSVRKQKPLPVPAQRVHKVRVEIWAKTRRYMIRLAYLRLRKGTFIHPGPGPMKGMQYGPQTKIRANRIILDIFSPTDEGLKQESISDATQNFLFEDNY